MAGIRDWIRSRSKSRSRASQDLKTQTKATEKGETKNLPPLPLERADSTYNKIPEQQPQQRPPRSSRSSKAYHQSSRSQASVSAEPLSPLGGYDSIPAGEAPTRGTYPLHGNGDRPPSLHRANSKSPARTSTARSLDSGSRRRFSDRPINSTGQSLPPGIAVTTDEPVTAPTTSTPVQRQPVSALVTNMYNSQYGASRGEPAVPRVPGQYRPQSATSAGVPNPSSAEAASPRVSTSSRTPIAEEFASSSWHGRHGSQEIPTADHPRSSHTLRHQPDVDNLNDEATAQGGPIVLSRDSSLPLNSPSRGRIPRQSLEKPLPVPTELQNAPWNRENAMPSLSSSSQPNASTINGAQTRDTQVDELATRVQPLSIQDRGQTGQMPAIQGQSSATIRDVSDVPIVPHEYSEATPDDRYPTPGSTPFYDASTSNGVNPFDQGHIRSGSAGIPDKALAIKNSAIAPSLKGFVDLTNTEDTSVHEKTAPAVIHELVLPTVHHIRHEEITREIHTHDVYHRQLPIIDVQVLPARHFVPSHWVPADSPLHPNNVAIDAATATGTSSHATKTGTNGALDAQAVASANAASGFVEVPHNFLPERTIDKYTNRNWIIAETASKLPIDGGVDAKSEPQWRRFTAKTFEGTEGDLKQWTDEKGIQRSEQTWVHPPTHDTVLKEKGLTQPLYMDE